MSKLNPAKLFIFSILSLSYLGCGALPKVSAQEQSSVFSTWEGFEVDKCASIWLIKRYINKNATIRIFPKGELITEGIQFDTPEAKFRRYHNMSTFESLLKHYRLEDPKLIHLGKVIHDVEVNVWERKIFKETPLLETAIYEITKNAKNHEDIIYQCLHYFDRVYDKGFK